MNRPTVLFIGGKPFNVPDEMNENFDIVRHIEQDEKRPSGNLPTVDYVFVLTNWVDHKNIQLVQRRLPNTPVIYMQKGWNAMSAELLRRGILKEKRQEPTPQVVEEPIPQDIMRVVTRLHDLQKTRDTLSKRKEDITLELKNIEEQMLELSVQIEKLAPLADSLSRFISDARRVT